MIFIAAVRLAVWRAVAVGAAVLMFAGCSDGGDGAIGAPSATVPTLPPQTTTTNPYAIPDVIDAAYVNRVLAGLDAAVGDIVRLVVTTRSIPPEAIERLRAVYMDQALFQLTLDLLQDDLRRGLQGYKTNPGTSVTTVTDLLSSQSSCIFAKVFRDASSVATSPDPRFSTLWVAIRPYAQSSKQFNQTGWGYVYEGFERDLSAPRVSPCSAA
jgi:hypothetical protein